MSPQFTTSITYFLEEGRGNLGDCLRIAFGAAVNHKITKIIIFTLEGLGLRMALDQFLSQEAYKDIGLVAVTFPTGHPFADSEGRPLIFDIPTDLREKFQKHQIPIVKAHLPFEPIAATYSGRGLLGQDLSLVGNALNMFGGSMSLCVQAVTLSCDAGVVLPGEHVIALTSDTAILAQACPTRYMLSGLVIREILCKPAIYSVGRGEKLDVEAAPEIPVERTPELLPPERPPQK